jgi:ABC-type branched-subunit amino acid transport system substrate-binding protein
MDAGSNKDGVMEGEQMEATRSRLGYPKTVQTLTVGLRRRRAVIVVIAVALLITACGSSQPASAPTTTKATVPSTAAPTGAPSPGVTATSVSVGQVDDLTLPLPGLFKGAEDGTEAYFDYINSIGGVNGRMIKLDAADSLYSDGAVASATQTQIKNDFALVGGFSLDDAAEEPLVASAKMPVIAYPLDPGLANLPDSFSPFPNADNEAPTTIFKVLKKKFPTQIKHVGILWANATASTAIAEKSFERAAKAEGFKIVYDASFTPSQTTFLANVLTMKSDGVQMFFTQQLPDSYAETVAKEMAEQNFHPINVEEDAYTSNLVKDGGSAVNGMYIAVGFALYLGTDDSVPAVKLFTKWMNKADPSANFELESLFGWASAELFVDGLKDAGSPPTRAGLEAALDKVTSFNANGLLATGDPAQNLPASCVILAQIQNGAIVRVAPTPKTGFICLPNSLLPEPGFKPEVRPTPGS